MKTSKFLKIGIEAAREAGEVLMSFWRRTKEVAVKSDHFSNIVSKADLESEKKIISLIKNRFPEHAIYSEEKGMSDNFSEYLWIIDPLDGTPGFINGLENFGISVGLLYHQEPIIGIIYLPAFDKLFTAERDKGAYLNDKKIVMSNTSKLSNSIIAFDYGYADKERKISDTLMKLVPFLRYPLTFGSASFSLAYLADSRIQGYVIPCPTPFDIGGGALIVEEAGGKVSDFSGLLIDWSKKETTFLASCPGIHQDIINILKK